MGRGFVDQVRLWLWLKSRGIKIVIFDFDDTLNDLYPLFLVAAAQCHTILAEVLSGIDLALAKKRMQELNDYYFLRLGVNPFRWASVFQDLVKEFGITKPGVFERLCEAEYKVYRSVPPLKEGALVVLQVYQHLVRLGLVTHANQDWHRLKVTTLGLCRYFPRQKVINENRHKDKASWLEVFDEWGIVPHTALVVEDSLRSLIAANAAGVNCLVWLDQGSGWRMYRNGTYPKGLLKIGWLSELLYPWRIKEVSSVKL